MMKQNTHIVHVMALVMVIYLHVPVMALVMGMLLAHVMALVIIMSLVPVMEQNIILVHVRVTIHNME